MFVFMGNFTSSPFGKDSSDVLEYKHHFDALADLLLGKRREVGVCGTGGRTAKEHHHCVLPVMFSSVADHCCSSCSWCVFFHVCFCTVPVEFPKLLNEQGGSKFLFVPGPNDPGKRFTAGILARHPWSLTFVSLRSLCQVPKCCPEVPFLPISLLRCVKNYHPTPATLQPIPAASNTLPKKS